VKSVKDRPEQLPANEKSLGQDAVEAFANQKHLALSVSDLGDYNCLRFTLYVKDGGKKKAPDFRLFVYEDESGELILRPASAVSKESVAALVSALERIDIAFVREPETVE
jgi:hypothetical protein